MIIAIIVAHLYFLAILLFCIFNGVGLISMWQMVIGETGSVASAIFIMFILLHGYVNLTRVVFRIIDDLLSKKIDIRSAYLSNEIYRLDKLGIKYNIWNPKDYGFDFYADILFTSIDEVQNHSKRVERFQKASMKGWKYAFSHMEESVNIILKKYNTQNKTKDELLYEAKVLKDLAYTDSKKLGDISKEKIQRIYDIYNIMGLTKNKIDVNNFILIVVKTV